MNKPYFVLWLEPPPYDEYWVISDARTSERLLQTRDERFARAMYRIMQTERGWWD